MIFRIVFFLLLVGLWLIADRKMEGMRIAKENAEAKRIQYWRDNNIPYAVFVGPFRVSEWSNTKGQ
jgi:hypothetical protein